MQKIDMTPEFRKTIPWRLIVIFIFFSIAIIVGGIFFYKSQRNRIFTENQNSLTAISILKIEQIEQWRKERLGNAATIRNNEPLIRSIKQYLKDENQPDLRRELLKWMESVYISFDYSGVCILDTLLKTRLSISRIDSVGTGNLKNELSMFLDKQIIVFKDLHRTQNKGSIHMDLLIPLIESNKGNTRPFGILILRIDPDKILFPLIQSWPTPSKSAETLLLRKDGDSVVFLNELRHKQNTTLNLKLPLTEVNLLATMAVLGKRGVVEGTDYRDTQVVGCLAGIPDFDWFMVAKIDKEEIQEPLKRYFVITILFCVVLILINASVFGFFIWNQRLNAYRMKINDELAIRESEEKLRETNEYLNSLFNYANAPIIVWDTSLIITQFNPAFENLSGYSKDDVTGKKIDMLFNRANLDASLHLIKMAVSGERWEVVEIEIQRKDGDTRIVLWNSANILDYDGKTVLATIAQGQDITKRKKAEDEIRLQSEILSHMSEAVYLVKMRDGIIVFANSKFESMFGYEEGEMIGKHVSVVNAPTKKSPEETASEIMSSLAEKGLWRGEVLNIRKDGTNFWTHANVTIFDHSQFGEVLISVQNDITERKIAETQIKKLNEDLEGRVIQRTQQLEAVNKELEAFSYSVSHDLRAPLRSVHGYTKILLEEYENKLDDEGKRICKIITSSATQMGGLIDDLLSFSRIGRSNLNPTSIDMKKMVRLLYEGMTTPSERERIQLTIGKLQKSYGDVPLIGQVWVNLLSNAIKYSSKKEISDISIGSHINEGLVTYFVKDNGVGFNIEYASKLFGVFQRLHTEREFEGNGVGLAIVQRIILKHGGKVWAEGEVGKGATFYFSLPIQDKGQK
jgi:PAS domain S-box-containing protein